MKLLNKILNRTTPFLWFASFVMYAVQNNIAAAAMAAMLTIYAARDFE